MTATPSTDHYPSLEELLNAYDNRVPIPDAVVARVRQRYDAHGGDYATDQRHTDGRIVNGCMMMDTLESTEEELVDAVFNLLVLMFKKEYRWHPPVALAHVLQALNVLEHAAQEPTPKTSSSASS